MLLTVDNENNDKSQDIEILSEITNNPPFPAISAAVRCGQSGCAGFRIPGHQAVLRGTAHREGIDEVRVAIAGTTVAIRPTIARSPHVDVSEPASTLN